jgi:DNA recombination protein RmuC
MDTGIVLILLTVIISGFVTIYLLVSRRLSDLSKSRENPELLKYFQADLAALRESVDSTKESVNQSLLVSNKNVADSITASTRDIHERLTRASEVIGELKREAGAFTEVSRSMKELHEFLRSPKLRGNIGEAVLKDLISQMFPKNSFHLQYAFKSGEKVDAAIRTDAGILPIDSKFPMENFQKMAAAEDAKEVAALRRTFLRDIKKHIDDISRKYILPEEDTLDFALMYIPSESVYYEIMNETELSDYSRSRRVYPVSPTTMYASLQTILLSYEGKKIEKKAKEVFKMLRAIEKDYSKSSATLTTLGSHLTNAYNKFSDVTTTFNSLGQKLSSTRELSAALEEEKELEIKPLLED